MKKVLVLLALLMAPQAGLAGEQLRLRAGVVNTRAPQVTDFELQFQAQWLSDALPQSHEVAPNARFFVVQFKSKISKSAHQLIRTLGAKPLRYIPDDALIIDANQAIVSKLRLESDVQAVLPYRSEWKMSDGFVSANIFSQNREGVVVRVLDANLAPALASKLKALGAEVHTVAGRAVAGYFTRKQIEVAAQFDGVEWIQPAPQMELMHADLLNSDLVDSDQAASEPSPAVQVPANPYLALTGYESGTKLMNFESAWKRGFDGSGQTVAVADTGYDSGDSASIHPDFAGRMAGQVFGMFSVSWGDPAGHGTHVAGSIAGSGELSGGLLKGGAPKAKLIGQSMWSPVLSNLVVPQKLSDMFSQAYSEGARVHSNSWGSIRNLGAYDAFAVQVDEFAFANPDFLILFAAGNNGADRDKNGRIDPGSITAPGTAKNALTVGASENLVDKGGIQEALINLKGGPELWGAEPLASDTLSNNPGGIAAFSSRGPTLDGRIKPDLVAPGANILSTKSRQGAQALWGRFNDDYIWSGGTSMSTPLVAGAAVVVRQYLITEKKLATPSAAMIKNVLMHSAVDLFPGQYGEIGEVKGQEILSKRPTPDEGWGRVDVSRATSLVRAKLVDDKVGVGLNESKTFKFRIEQARKVTASLVWTDAPASPNAAQALVNDLDLSITGNGVNFEAQDRVNNSELIYKDIAPGTYEVTVTGANVPQGALGKQPFALVITVD